MCLITLAVEFSEFLGITMELDRLEIVDVQNMFLPPLTLSPSAGNLTTVAVAVAVAVYIYHSHSSIY